MSLFAPTYDPSPEAIARACAALRRGWTPAERNRRRAGPVGLSNRLIRCAERQGPQPVQVELTPALAVDLQVVRELL